MHQVLSHFQADQSAADNYCRARSSFRDPFPNFAAVGQSAQSEDSRQVNSRPDGTNRRGTRREHESVIVLNTLRSVVEIYDRQSALLAIDCNHFMFCARLDVEPFTEELRRGEQQLAFVLNHVANIIRKTAIRERDIRPPIQNKNLGVLVQPAQARCASCPTRNTSHNDHPLLTHDTSLARGALGAGRLLNRRKSPTWAFVTN